MMKAEKYIKFYMLKYGSVWTNKLVIKRDFPGPLNGVIIFTTAFVVFFYLVIVFSFLSYFVLLLDFVPFVYSPPDHHVIRHWFFFSLAICAAPDIVSIITNNINYD